MTTECHDPLVKDSHLTSVYDGSTITYRILRAIGWGPQLLNLGYHAWSGPLTFLNMLPGRLRLSRRQIDLVAKSAVFLDPKPGDKILDVACGRGFSSFYLSHLVPGIEVIGTDLLPENINVAKTLYNYTQGLSFEVVDAEAMPYEDEAFDKIFCLEAAFHFSNKEKFIQECNRLLKPGGLLVLVDFAWKSDQVRQSVDPKKKELVSSIWGYSDFYTVDEYLKVAKEHGLKLKNISDWTSKVTKPLLRQFRWLCKLGNSRLGRKLLALSNDQLRIFSKADWRDLAVSEDAHSAVHRDAKYVVLSLEKNS
jgi:ubiquinone/menaquinone biosynthesis C-methylase UbiE